MGKKGRKTRWRKLPIQIGTNSGRGTGCEKIESDEPKRNYQQTQQETVPSKFNEDEYTKITTPRQDMLFKKGHFGKKKTTVPIQDSTESQSAAGDSVESESYMGDETGNPYTWGGGMDPSGMYYMNNGYEMFDPYMGAVTTVIVAPGPLQPYGPPTHNGHPGAPHQLLAAVPCGPIPLQPLEWFNPGLPPLQAYHPPTANHLHEKRRSCDSLVNCSGPNSESNGAFDTPPELIKGEDDASSSSPYHHPQYIYPGAYMFGAPLYNMNGLNVQGVMQPCMQPQADPKRRKKRRKRRRGGAVTDEGSESSCEENMSCEAGNESQSGSSSDTALGSSSSKTNSDSGIHADQTPNSGSDSPQNFDPPFGYQTCSIVSPVDEQCNYNVAPQVLNSVERVIETPKVETICCATELESCHDSELLSLKEAVQLEEVSLEKVALEFDSAFQTAERASPSQQLVKTCDEVDEQSLMSGEHNCIAHSDSAQISSNTSNMSFLDQTADASVEKQFFSVSEDLIEEKLEPLISKPPTEFVPHQVEYTPTEVDDDLVNASEISVESLTIIDQFEDVKGSAQDTLIIDVSSSDSNVVDINAGSAGQITSCNSLNEDVEKFIEEFEQRCDLEEPVLKECISEESIAPLSPDPEGPPIQLEEEREVSADIIEPQQTVIMTNMADKPITQAVTRWLENQGTSALTSLVVTGDDELSEDEGIEEGVDPLTLTGQKNGEGNPFLASSLSGSRTRVAKTMSSSDWEFDKESRRRKAMCDARSSVNKYYRLAVDQDKSTIKSPDNKTNNKTVLRMGHEVPFPCGVCCILQ